MKDVIQSKEELLNILENGLWNSFRIENIILKASNDGLDIKLSISEIYPTNGNDEIEVKNLVLSFYNIKKIISNNVHEISLNEFVKYLNSNIDLFEFIGIAPSFFEFKIGLQFGTLDDIRFFEVELECQKIEIERKKSSTKQIEKFLSTDVLKLEIVKKGLPSALDIINFFKEKEIEVYFSDYWGKKLEIQEIKTNLNGVFLKKRTIKITEGIQISLNKDLDNALLELMNFSDDPTLFNIFIYEFIISLNFEKISCGNMNFSKEEWEQFIISNEFLNISKISTIET